MTSVAVELQVKQCSAVPRPNLDTSVCDNRDTVSDSSGVDNMPQCMFTFTFNFLMH